MTTCPTCGAGSTACTSRTLTSGRHCCDTCTDHRHPTATAPETQARGRRAPGCPPLLSPRTVHVTLGVTAARWA